MQFLIARDTLYYIYRAAAARAPELVGSDRRPAWVHDAHHNQQIISLSALARTHYRSSIGTRAGAQVSAAN
jgi:hypothetical protein